MRLTTGAMKRQPIFRLMIVLWRHLVCCNSARGRCGEESTLAVSAMRSVGIPARQCYVPRWAHCDDNHAWVEVWADGDWHYLGACEPEPVLDKVGLLQLHQRQCLFMQRHFQTWKLCRNSLQDTALCADECNRALCRLCEADCNSN